MFTRSAITPAGSERVWIKFGALRVYCRSWPWQILGAIRAEARAVELAEIMSFLSRK